LVEPLHGGLPRTENCGRDPRILSFLFYQLKRETGVVVIVSSLSCFRSALSQPRQSKFLGSSRLSLLIFERTASDQVYLDEFVMKPLPFSLAALAIIFSAASPLCAEIPIKSGEKVAFLGDSITQGGQSSAGGYVQLIGSGLAANGVKIEIIGAGISGHKSNQMLERLERDVLSKNPDWMTLSCGVNDVWHGAKGVALPDYQKNITEIVDKAQAAKVKVIILTSTMIREDPANAENQKLIAYNDFLRALAKEKKCHLADLNADMQAALIEAAKTEQKSAKGNYLTSDGVHMALAGNLMMAEGVLKGLGLNAGELAKAKEAWLELPLVTVSASMGLTQRQAKELDKLAKARQLDTAGLLNQELREVIEAELNGKAR
jgi:lysophospholipase L1-like esterase